MPANQRNFQWFTYTDDAGNAWNKKGSLDAAINAIDGSTAFTAGARVWPHRTRRYHTREAIFKDATTQRKVKIPVYTTAAYTAIVKGTTTLAISVPGLATTVTYTAFDKIGEKTPSFGSVVGLTDHP